MLWRIDRPKWLLVALAPALTRTFYLPGVAPTEYLEGGQVDMKVNKLTSVKTQIPYDYYTLPFCQPTKIKESVENLGEVMTGDKIENSPYEIYMKTASTCKLLCRRPLKDMDKDKLRNMIDDEYIVNWIIDNLPAATRVSEETYFNGFPVGLLSKSCGSGVASCYLVYNHVRIRLLYHSNPDKYVGYRIVGFEVEPKSIAQTFQDGGASVQCGASLDYQPFDLDTQKEIVYTYDVLWEESPIRWASRWDNYLKMTNTQIHWFSIMNSLMIMILLAAMVAMILLRTLHRDIVKYNEVATTEESAEETGWKLVHGDVFRKPAWSRLLAASVGSGLQVSAMALVVMIFALAGLLSPSNRGALLQSMMMFFTLMGILGGYASSRFYKIWGGEDWRLVTLLTAFLYPGIVFAIFFVLNLFIWGKKSSGAVPFTMMFAILVLWFGISVPLVFLGSYFGYRKPAIELPVRVNQVPREIKEQTWATHPVVSSMLGGLLPFGAMFTELFFIMSSIWQHRFYYLFGFLALALVIVSFTCAEISITLTYYQLTAENYHWWWRSFFASGSCAFYLFLYSIIYFNGTLQLSMIVSQILYFGYMFIASLLLFLLTGSIGCLSSFIFVRAIYGSIKVD